MNMRLLALRRSVTASALAALFAASALAPAASATSVYATGWTSSNWSGYIVQSDAPYTSVNGQWSVPAVSSSQSGFSAAWVGIGGVDEGNLIQVGTEQDAGFGGTSYTAWWE